VHLLKAIEKATIKNPSLRNKLQLILVGNAEHKDIHCAIDYISIGYCNDAATLKQYYQAADIFCLPSFEDNLPNTVMEALACGTCVLAYDVGGVSDMVLHEYNGYLSKYKNMDDLADGIVYLSEVDRTPLNENARQKVLDTFSNDVVVRRLINLYQQ